MSGEVVWTQETEPIGLWAIHEPAAARHWRLNLPSGERHFGRDMNRNRFSVFEARIESPLFHGVHCCPVEAMLRIK